MSSVLNPLIINKELVISSFNTIDYYNLGKDFYQIPDSHPYWEMVYVDRGDVITNYNGIGHTLQEGQVIFHPPHSMHSHISNRLTSNSILVVSFSSDSPILNRLRQKTFFLSGYTQNLLTRFLDECKKNLGDITNTSGGMPRALSISNEYVGASHILECCFVEFLYSVLQSNLYDDLKKTESSCIIVSNSFIELIKSYLCDNVYRTLTLDDLCRKFGVSKSNLCKKWKEHSEIGVIDYFISLKIKEAKRLIKNGEYSVTQIADMLGYSTIHHFSHSFKKNTGVSPSEYKKSII